MKTCLVVLAIVLASASAYAQGRPHPTGFGPSDFEANKKFGLGLELGDLVGITGKLFVNSNQAIDFGIGDRYYGPYGNAGGLHIYADYLWHPKVLARPDAFELPFYIGVGARFWDFGYACNPNGTNCMDATTFGVRMPIGIDFDFNNVPLDVFIELAPTLDFFHDYTNHSLGLDYDFSIGVRYWFS
ncbi:MAG TPA: DUF3996 domain-containing protein [Kofleriaceae bacterium]|nr:DUF3996 domain-containing protein [Kofleriaceae bacterium]